MSGIVTEYECIKCEAIFSDDKKHRYLLKKTWDESKPHACVIMFNPHFSDCLRADNTTNKIMNYLVSSCNGYGGIYFMNLYSIMESDKDAVTRDKKDNPPETDKYLTKAFENSSDIFLAWGINEDNKKRIKQVKAIIDKVIPNKKIYRIYVEVEGESKPYHPAYYPIKEHKPATKADFS